MQPNLNTILTLMGGASQPGAGLFSGLGAGKPGENSGLIDFDGSAFKAELKAMLQDQKSMMQSMMNGLEDDGSGLDQNAAVRGFLSSVAHRAMSMRGEMPASMFAAGIAGKGVNLNGVSPNEASDTVQVMDQALMSEIQAEIRAEVLKAVEAGEITLPEAWVQALENGTPINPQADDGMPDPAMVAGVLTALGLIDPSSKTGMSAPGETKSNGAADTLLPGRPDQDGNLHQNGTKAAAEGTETTAQMGTGATGSSGSGSEPGHTSQAASIGGRQGFDVPQTAATLTVTGSQEAHTLRAQGGQAPNADNQTPAQIRQEARAELAASVREQARSDRGQNNAVSGAGGPANDAKSSAAAGLTAGTAGNSGSSQGQSMTQAGTGDAAASTEKSANLFLARLETALEARGLQLAPGLGLAADPTMDGDMNSEIIGDLRPRDGAPTVTPLGQSGAVTGTPATAQAPGFSGWTPAAAQVAMQISRMARDGNQEFTIRLDPPELGRVDVRLDIAHDGKVNAVISLDNEKALQLLQRDQSLLERALADAGLKTDGGSLNFSLNQQDGMDRDHADSGSGQGGSERGMAATDMNAAENIPAARMILSDRALDISV